MRRKSILAVGAGLLLAGWGPVRGEDTRHKWQFGVGASYFSTEDDIRSDADQAGCTGVFPNLSCPERDPRPDQNLLSENTIQDDVAIGINASYGLTRFFALELSGGYFEGTAEPLETFRAFTRFNPVTGQLFAGPDGSPQVFTENRFFPAAEITEIPIRLSGLFRFRPESPFAPYVGAGIGYLFNDLEVSGDIGAMNAQLNDFQQTDLDPPYGADGIVVFDPGPGLPESLQAEPSRSDFGVVRDPLQITVNDGFTFHLRGGVDYYFTKRVSLYVDGTYTWTNPALEIKILGLDSGQITVRQRFDDGADRFRGPFAMDDVGGSLTRRAATASDTCRYQGFSGVVQGSLPECLGDDLNNDFRFDPATETLGPDGVFNRTFGVCTGNCEGAIPQYAARFPSDPSTTYGTLTRVCTSGPDPNDPNCPSFEWINKVGANGSLGAFVLGPGDDIVGTNNFIVQGGEIDLEGFTLGVGVKFTF